ncbi:MAG: ferredoxin [gamma proteobacterium symbiont of Bathyaustriella thionipta]|nr:ferredoxin [gamma proteobacterium symbiont of Bathyaustriella thionipta]MCU7948899.1 ferredoxin [gamma proteobacterium symbiont of Bathyaustriella thionipta]MCU7953211.1 ferredoxin [gamma proteobacterium symbiont of Bathyaustriella thionipta]MCU7955473.1 ferredoxin [gamma proteobacterium symbiont of Bathyaustriella thionipta]MCU7965680.1 ferredoxin [gamma proteobacterium symbiont of Bathyaustriella thionipta]
MTSTISKQFLPALPFSQAVSKDSDSSESDVKSIMHTLRHFHLGNPAAAEQLESISDEFLPALLSAYRDASQLRYDYPLYLCPCDATNSISLSLAKPLPDFLQERVSMFAPSEDSAILLKDNIPWIERHLRNVTRTIEGPALIKPLLEDACQKLNEHLQFDGDNQQRLQSDIDKLIDNVPDDGLILGYGRFPALHLLMHLMRNQALPQMSLFKQETEEYVLNLQNLLDVDDTQKKEARSSEALKSNIGSNQYFNTESLSNIVQQSSKGSISLSSTRRKRIEGALQALHKFKEKEILIHIVHANDALDNSWLNESQSFTSEHHSDPCFRATEIFDQEAQELAEVFAAARIAKLEIDNLYDENIHDPWFDNFNWESFSKKELILVPSVIVLEAANRLVDESMVSFAHLLNSGRPVNLFVRVQAHNNPGAKADEDPFHNYRTELGYLGISHRQAVVTQCSAARHQLLLQQFDMSLNATRTSLHLINVGLREVGEDSGLNAWLVAGAALEGRAHPFFSIDPGAGDSFADRMDFSGNPQPERDWPTQTFAFRNEASEVNEMELDFTFADYALLIPRLNYHFALVPVDCDSQDLLPVAEYLALPVDEVDNFVPYIWAVNEANELRRLAVSRALIHACRDRLNFWHSLQEMAGIRSRYIDDVEQRIQAEADAEIAAQVAQAKAEFSAELDRVKTEAAVDVMGRLTDMLLGMDLSGSSLPAGAAMKSAAPAAPASVEDAVEETVVEEVEEETETFDEAWIDSPLCTTCNDCTDMNPLMFVYNDTNQAIIADLNAGTYLQMVEAAEICPSRCIHPGKPWDKSEADLDELMERAVPFNSF